MNPIEPGPVARPDGWRHVVYAKDQPQYKQLPSLVSLDRNGMVVTRWRPTWRERWSLLFGADVWLSILTFNQPLQPSHMVVGTPEHFR